MIFYFFAYIYILITLIELKKNINFRYIDLFAGCGGLSLGLHNAGWKGIFAIEKNIDAFKTLKFNLIERKSHFEWPEWLPVANYDINYVIRKYAKQLEALKGEIDLVAGGPPCQGFSTAGKRNEGDQRNTLIKSYIKFIKLIKPKIIFFENVKGFTLEFKKNREIGKRYSDYVIKSLTNLGYKVDGHLVDFSEYGVPQKRVRFILVGVRNDIADGLRNRPNNFFEELINNRQDFCLNKGSALTVTLQDAISDLLMEHGQVLCPDNKKFVSGEYFLPRSTYQELMRMGSTNIIPDSHRFANHTLAVSQKFADILSNQVERNKNLDVDLRKRFNIKKHTIIPLHPLRPSPTITTLPDDLIHYSEPRILTVREYARIQSFPDWYEFKGKYTTGGKQRTQEVPRYSQIGNAIPPLFAEQSGLVLKKLI